MKSGLHQFVIAGETGVHLVVPASAWAARGLTGRDVPARRPAAAASEQHAPVPGVDQPQFSVSQLTYVLGLQIS
jgi:hypothetical protein